MKNIITLFFLFFIVNHSFSQDPYFPPLIGSEWETVSPTELNWCDTELTGLQTWLGDNNTKAFIILKDGKIAVEWYYDTFTQDSIWYWASAGKSLTAFMTGIAQEEGYLDINDKTSDYLGDGWTSASQDKEDLITIWHQLTMTSGLDDSEFDCLDPSCLTYLEDAGNRWSYHNSPYTLLSYTIEAALGTDYNGSYNNFTFNKLTLSTGLIGSWIEVGDNRVFFSRPRDMARFGLLVSNDGVWDNTTVLSDLDYINDMRTPSQNINESYGYLWWLNGQSSHMLPSLQLVFNSSLAPNAPADMYAGIGKNGQILNVIPSQDLIVVRMGNNPDESLVPTIFHDEMWEKINDVICNSTSTEDINSNNELNVFPNPTSDILNIETYESITSVEVFSVDGKSVLFSENKNQINIQYLNKGIYFARVIIDDEVFVVEFLKE